MKHLLRQTKIDFKNTVKASSVEAYYETYGRIIKKRSNQVTNLRNDRIK